MPGVGEAMIVSTCNRVELYAGVDGEDAIESLQRFLIDERQLPSTPARAPLRARRRTTPCATCSASPRRSTRWSSASRRSSGRSRTRTPPRSTPARSAPILQRAVPRAFALAKRVRTETDVARNSASIASAAVDLAAQIFGDLDGRHVLVVGAGKMGDLSARHLKAAGIGELSVVNRTRRARGRAGRAARRQGGAVGRSRSRCCTRSTSSCARRARPSR